MKKVARNATNTDVYILSAVLAWLKVDFIDMELFLEFIFYYYAIYEYMPIIHKVRMVLLHLSSVYIIM